MSESGFHVYTRACGWSLARAHARSRDRLAIAAYLGAGSSFDDAIARFSSAYADQNERDHQQLVRPSPMARFRLRWAFEAGGSDSVAGLASVISEK